jgi:hypothetical protein
MSSSTTSALSAGVQQLYNAGLLPSHVSDSTLNRASSSQINKMTGSAIALQEVGELFGIGGSSATDSVSLSSTASASSGADPLTAAVDHALTSQINAAVNQFAPSTSAPTTGSLINLLA